MCRAPAAWAWWPAVGAPFERGVRPHSTLRQPVACLTCKLKPLDKRIVLVPLGHGRRHAPRLTWVLGSSMVQRCQIATDSGSLIDDYRDVRDATKGTARLLDFLVIRVQKVDSRLVSRFGSGAALYRDTQDLLARRSTCNEIDSRMVDVSALEAPLG